MKNFSLVSSLFIMLSFLAPALPACAASTSTLDGRIHDAQEVLDELMSAPDQAIPAGILASAHGVMIVTQYKGGYIVGGKGGSGIAMAHLPNGSWSAPCFVTSGEASFGPQIGGQEIDSVFLIMTEEGMGMLYKSKMVLGVDASVAAGPVGRDAEVKVNPNTAVLSYSRTKGAYIGASFEGGALLADKDADRQYYNDEQITTKDILFGGKAQLTDAAKALADKLAHYATKEKPADKAGK